MGSGKIRVAEVLGELYTIVHLFQVYLRDEESETKNMRPILTILTCMF